MKFTVALTGCSGMAYGVRLLQVLQGEKSLVVSEMGKKVLRKETPFSFEDLKQYADFCYDDDNLFAPIASGSHKTDGMIIIPCTQSTLARISTGISDTLITRSAAVALKEGRNLIVVPREAPLSAIMLENELRLARAGATILPASPAFYNQPSKIEEMIDFVVGKVLDHLGQEHSLFKRWE